MVKKVLIFLSLFLLACAPVKIDAPNLTIKNPSPIMVLDSDVALELNDLMIVVNNANVSDRSAAASAYVNRSLEILDLLNESQIRSSVDAIVILTNVQSLDQTYNLNVSYNPDWFSR